MSISVTTNVSCDRCSETSSLVSSRVQIKKARAKARSCGWVTRRIEGRKVDLCPQCAREFLVQLKENNK